MKRAPALRSLSSEHHSALVFARRISLAATEAAVAEAWSETLRRFGAELEPHFREEEAWLLPALERAGDIILVQRALEEHSCLRLLVYEGVRDASTLAKFAELLQAHVRFEERELFEIAQARLPALCAATRA